MGWFLFARIKLFLALFAEQFDVIFETQNDSFVAHHRLGVLGDDFVQLLANALLVGDLNFKFGNTGLHAELVIHR